VLALGGDSPTAQDSEGFGSTSCCGKDVIVIQAACSRTSSEALTFCIIVEVIEGHGTPEALC